MVGTQIKSDQKKQKPLSFRVISCDIDISLPSSLLHTPYSINNPRTSTNLYYYHHFYSCSFSSLFSSLSALHAHGKSCRFINVNILSFHGPTTFYVYFIIIVLSMFSNCRGHSFFFILFITDQSLIFFAFWLLAFGFSFFLFE